MISYIRFIARTVRRVMPRPLHLLNYSKTEVLMMITTPSSARKHNLTDIVTIVRILKPTTVARILGVMFHNANRLRKQPSLRLTGPVNSTPCSSSVVVTSPKLRPRNTNCRESTLAPRAVSYSIQNNTNKEHSQSSTGV